MNKALALLEEMLPYLRPLPVRLGGPNWPYFIERAEEIIKEERRKFKFHPALAALVDNGRVPLYDGFYLCRLPQEEQEDLAKRIDTITVGEYRDLIQKGKR